jgi:iron complex transport system permease protein
MLAGLAMLFAAGPGLRALTLGEEAASSLGADLSRLRALVIAGAALLVGASVSIAGAVGFVGVVSPHLARPLVGHDPAKSIAPAALIGGVILAAADLFVRLMPFDQELKLGVAAALIGAPGFVWIAARTQRLAA